MTDEQLDFVVKATPLLAKAVLGLEPMAKNEFEDGYSNRQKVQVQDSVILESGGCCYRVSQRGLNVWEFDRWDPFTSVAQAHELLETWCAKAPKRVAKWDHDPEYQITDTVVLFDDDTELARVGRSAFPLAATFAACKAENIEVPDD